MTRKTKRTQLNDLAAQQELTGQEMKTVKGGVGSPVPPPPPVPPGTVTANKTVDKASPKLYEKC